MNEIRPNKSELAFLELAYGRFLSIHKEVVDDSFWSKDAGYRFSIVANGFAVYSEVLNYEPIKWVIEHLKTARPPMEAEISSDLFKFIRNIFAHFPFFESWDTVWISRLLVNWCTEGQSIDKFLSKYSGKDPVKYRFWENDRKRMTYLSINFPAVVHDDTKIFLRDILNERDGVRFAFILMKQVMATQIDNSPSEAGAIT